MRSQMTGMEPHKDIGPLRFPPEITLNYLWGGNKSCQENQDG
jgi:hypothetical protein